jgi:4'-phosphopantetheinyl transferase
VWTRLGLFDGRPESRRAALLDFCAETIGVARERLALEHDRRGAPHLLVDGARGEWSVSSSSRADVFMFGVARGERIGVDVEIAHPLDPPDAALHPEERTRLAALPQALRAERFYELWTAKEAFLKSLGLGLTVEPSRLLVTPRDEGFTMRMDGDDAPLAEARWRRDFFAAGLVISASVTRA